MAYFGSADIKRHGMPVVRPLTVDQTVAGWLAVSLLKLKMDRELSWLEELTPEVVVGRSINLYHIRKKP
jgi:hypothetical protein